MSFKSNFSINNLFRDNKRILLYSLSSFFFLFGKFKHMSKRIIFVLILNLVFLHGCQRHEVIKTHGISYLEKREKLIHSK